MQAMVRFPVRALHLFLLIAVTAAVAPAGAQLASQVEDIGVGDVSAPSSSPRQLVTVGDRVVFLADEPASGLEVWGSDGTPRGTELLADGCTAEFNCPRPVIWGVGKGVVFWIAGPGYDGYASELWASDGTRRGTVQLTSLAAGIRIDRPDEPLFEPDPGDHLLIDGVLYFTAYTAEHGTELWRSDGSAEGTYMVVDFLPGPASGVRRPLRQMNGELYFFAVTEGASKVLARSDGRAGGTSPVTEVPIFARWLQAAGDRLFFVAAGDQGQELWASDGTAPSTMPITDFEANDPFSYIFFGWLKPVGGKVYFAADDILHGAEIWASDGTAAGTRRITDFGFYDPFGSDFGPHEIEGVGDTLLFIATDGLTGRKVWRTDGDPASMRPLADELCTGDCGAQGPLEFYRAGSRLFFPASDPTHGRELWALEAGGKAYRVADLCPGSCGDIGKILPVGGEVFFSSSGQTGASEVWRTTGRPGEVERVTYAQGASFGIREGAGWLAELGPDRVLLAGRDPLHGTELWTADGTPGGSRLVGDLARGAVSSDPLGGVALDDRLLFTACADSSREVWASDGSGGSTQRLTNQRIEFCSPFDAHVEPLPIIVAGGLGYFLRGFDPKRLWRTDGTPGGTFSLLTGHSGGECPCFGALVAHEDRLIFTVYQPDGSGEVWTSDGTPGGTELLFLAPGPFFSRLWSVGDHLYFFHPVDEVTQLWRSDGTTAGTLPISAVPGGLRYGTDPELTLVGETVYFVAEDGESFRRQLWRTDGTVGGTQPVAEVGEPLTGLTTLGGFIYFFGATEDFSELALWRSDGTAGGTVRLGSFRQPDPFEDPLFQLLAAGNRLFFVADDGEHGSELWTSDGTEAGTVMVRDIVPGPSSSSPLGLIAAGESVFFTARDDAHGYEVWTSDGTKAGTRLVHDLLPGPAGSTPAQLAVAGSRLYFSADDGLHGRELWSLPLGPDAPLCEAGGSGLCLNGGRFRAEIFWQTKNGKTGEARPVPLTADTGAFWFFDDANVESILKVLDGRGVNGRYWVFLGALSNVEYYVTAADGKTGAARRYFNPQGHFASLADAGAFDPLAASTSDWVDLAAAGLGGDGSPIEIAPAQGPPVVARECAPGPTRLCLQGGRFAVEASWRTPGGRTGLGTAVPLTSDTGLFWFFFDTNLEVAIKVLDGRALNDHFWVFYGALSSVEYTLTVTDTVSGETKAYHNPQGRMASVADTGAF